jgi:hypothetical protein
LISHLAPAGSPVFIDDASEAISTCCVAFAFGELLIAAFAFGFICCLDLTSLASAASEFFVMLLRIAQCDACCDDDEAAAAALSEAQSQLLFQGLGFCLRFMNEERLSMPRVCSLSCSHIKNTCSLFPKSSLLSFLYCFSYLHDFTVCCEWWSISMQVLPFFASPRPLILRLYLF